MAVTVEQLQTTSGVITSSAQSCESAQYFLLCGLQDPGGVQHIPAVIVRESKQLFLSSAAKLLLEIVGQKPDIRSRVSSHVGLFAAVRQDAVEGVVGGWYPSAHEALWAVVEFVRERVPLHKALGEGLGEKPTSVERVVGYLATIPQGVQLVMDEIFPSSLMSRLQAEARIELAKVQNTQVRTSPKNPHESNESRALAILLEHPDWINAKIARAVGIHRANLSKYPRFKAARKAQKLDRVERAKGHRTRSGGGVDGVAGWDEQ
jgi:hypothetical protein